MFAELAWRPEFKTGNHVKGKGENGLTGCPLTPHVFHWTGSTLLVKITAIMIIEFWKFRWEGHAVKK